MKVNLRSWKGVPLPETNSEFTPKSRPKRPQKEISSEPTLDLTGRYTSPIECLWYLEDHPT